MDDHHDLTARVRATSLLDGPVLVLLSGGRDSVCLLDCAVRLGGPVRALHVDHGLRPDSADDAAFCTALCASLGVPLVVERAAGRPRRNVQAWARGLRRAAATRVAWPEELVAIAHTATDQVETVLMRLAGQPGRRALLGMREREGRLVRPLLAVTREQTAAHCFARGLAWREDPSNAASARGRLRADVLPVLRELHPAAEANVLRTVALLREEDDALDAAARALPPTLAALDAAPPALARRALQAWADDASSLGPAPAVGDHLDAVLALRRTGTAEHHLPGGLRAIAEYGALRLSPSVHLTRHGRVNRTLDGTRFAERPLDPSWEGQPDARRDGDAWSVTDAPLPLSLTSAVRWHGGTLTAERETDDGEPRDGSLRLDPGTTLAVRAWRPGDRIRPLGMHGHSKSLQDLFTDRKVPRARRRELPVVLAGDTVAHVPGVVTDEACRVDPAAGGLRVRVRWHAAP